MRTVGEGGICAGRALGTQDHVGLGNLHTNTNQPSAPRRMDGTLDFLDHDHPSPVTHYNHERSTRSGLTLVLPPLKGGKPLKSATKGKPRTAQELDTPIEKRLPRPVKLKPLKEILSKLISQIKKLVEHQKCPKLS